MLKVMEAAGIEPEEVINWIADMPEFQTSDDYKELRKTFEWAKTEMVQ
jgi:hypothetical protein